MTKNTLKISWLGRSPLIEENSSTFPVCLTSQKIPESKRTPLFAKFAKENFQLELLKFLRKIPLDQAM